MDYSFSADFGTIIKLAAIAGALGGLVWDVANPIRRFSKEPPTGLDNKLTFPRLFGNKTSARGIDLGFLGPLIIGAATGVVTVLIAGRSGPDGADVLRQLADLSDAAAGSGQDAADVAEAADGVEDALATTIAKPTLYTLAFVGGIAGWAVLQAVANRLSSIIGVVVQSSATATGQAAGTAVREAAEAQGMNTAQAATLADAATTAVKETAAEIARPTDPA